jgi:predicted CoA-binding protein
MVTKQNIDDFYSNNTFAIVGASAKKKNNFGVEVIKELTKKGKSMIPVHRSADKIEDIDCIRSVSELPQDVNALIIVTNKKNTNEVVKEALDNGMKHIWLQQMSQTAESIELGKNSDANFIYKQCIMMHAQPVEGFHKFHRNLKGFFGMLPK